MRKVVKILLAVALLPILLMGCSKGSSESADLVVIGGGGAGMSAALEASEGGAKVIILEKMEILGGNTIRSTGGFNAIGTTVQEEAGIEDNMDIYMGDLLKGDYTEYDESLVRVFAENSQNTYEWITGLGVDLSEVVNSAGNSVKRLHRPSGGAAVGIEITKVLSSTVEKDENITVKKATEAREIVLDDQGAVKAIKIKDKDGKESTIDTKAIVIATGSYGANPEMIEKYRADLKGFTTTNHSGAQGDGIRMAEEVGAELVKMDDITIHPTVAVDKGIMISEGVRGTGAIVVNHDGKRFVSESDPSNTISESIFSQDEKSAFIVFDDGIRNNMGAIETYIKQGIITEGETLEELGEKLGIKDLHAFKETVERYNGFVENGKDEDFDRPNIEATLKTGPFYGSKIAPAVHGTKGGIKITEKTEVVKNDESVIEGLFASGECTGGVRGVADSIIFGRVSGKSVLEYLAETK